MKKKFSCEVDCANCAAKMTEAVTKLEGVKKVNINFMTQKMTLEAEDDRFDEILDQAVAVCKKVDSDFELTR